jgi:hypothetical protein
VSSALGGLGLYVEDDPQTAQKWLRVVDQGGVRLPSDEEALREVEQRADAAAAEVERLRALLEARSLVVSHGLNAY